MSNEALAKRIVALGVGYNYHGAQDHYGLNKDDPDWNKLLSASEFVQDGRVCLALMEKACVLDMVSIENWETESPDEPTSWAVDFGGPRCSDNESLAIAICEAACAALEGDDE